MGDKGEDDVRRRAYLLWEQSGRPHDRELDFWFAALHEGSDEPQKVVESRLIADEEPVNLALHQPSSLSSKWIGSPANVSATDGIKTGSFSFHTDIEDEPWWQVDLGTVCRIARIVVFNRLDVPLRANSMVVKVGETPDTLETVHRQNGQPFGGIDGAPAVIRLAGTKARYVRVGLEEREYLHLDEVEVYGWRDAS